MKIIPDVLVSDQGTIVLFSPQTEVGMSWLSWLRDNIQPESWQWLGDSLAVDHRMAQNIVEGMQVDGLILG